MLAILLLFITSLSLQATDEFANYIKNILIEAKEEHNLKESTLDNAKNDIVLIEKVIYHDKNQPERKKISVDDYIKKAVPEWKIKQANELYIQHKELLTKIGSEYKVQPRFILALWGIETNFGTYLGNYNLLASLSTLAFDGRRESLFKKELFSLLIMLDKGMVQQDQLYGSWAGAMGQVQFMPSTFLSYAVDYEKKGYIDLWTNQSDVFASAANYLKSIGWNDKYTWGREVSLYQDLDANLKSLKQTKNLISWQKIGVRKKNGSSLPRVDLDASLIEVDNKHYLALILLNYVLL